MSLKDLLRNLAKGDYDVERIDNEESGVSWGFYIDKGTHVQYRESKSNILGGIRMDYQARSDEKILCDIKSAGMNFIAYRLIDMLSRYDELGERSIEKNNLYMSITLDR